MIKSNEYGNHYYSFLTEEEKISMINSGLFFISCLKTADGVIKERDRGGWDYFNHIAKNLDTEFYEKYKLLFMD